MERLSGLDASFLYLESSAQLLHVCGVILLDPDTIRGGNSYETFKDELERRISGIAMFHRKLKQVPLGIDHPVWVKDEDCDRGHLPGQGQGDQERGRGRHRRKAGAATRSPPSSPVSAPTSRTRCNGCRWSPRATPTPRTTPGDPG